MTTRGAMRSEWDHELRLCKGSKESREGTVCSALMLFCSHPVPAAGDPVLERSWVQKALGMFARSWQDCPSKERKQRS